MRAIKDLNAGSLVLTILILIPTHRFWGFPKCENSSLTFCAGDFDHKKTLSRQDAKNAKKSFSSRTWRPLRLCARHSFSDLFFIQNFKYLWLDFGSFNP
jgi:hypothetical protein